MSNDFCDAAEIRIKNLEEEVAKGDRIIGELLNEGSEAIKKNKQLIQLLKECCTAFETYAKEDETCELEEENKYAKHLLIRINAAIGESEE